jgi:hypothetical protein
VDVDSLAARNGDVLDAVVSSTADVVFRQPTLVADDFSPLYPLDSFGRLVVDGMSSHQLSLTPTSLDTLLSGTTDNWLFGLVVRQNGYEPDTLRALSFKNYATDFSPTDIAAFHLYRDTGDGDLDVDTDEHLGPMIYSGDWIQVTGLNVSVSPSVLLFVTADIATTPTTGNHLTPGVPVGGVEMLSANDGPIDREVVVGKSCLLVRKEAVEVVSRSFPASQVHPGESDERLMWLEIDNRTAQTVTVDTLTLSNASTGLGSIDDLDRTLGNVKIYDDDGNGAVDSWDGMVAGGLRFTAGVITAGGLGVSVNSGQSRHLLIASDIDSVCARDGDDLRVEIPDAASIAIDQPFAVEGSFPLTTPAAVIVDGMMAHQLEVFLHADSLVVTRTTDILVMDLGLPGNGYAPDTLVSLEIDNLGSATSAHFSRLALYRDEGNATFDAGGGDDVHIGDLVEKLSKPGGRSYEITALSVPLSEACGLHTRLFVAADLRSDFSTGGSVQFAVPVRGVVVSSGNDGPLDGAVRDPAVRVIPTPDHLTVFPYSVGDQIVHPGSERNLNFGIGFYNGYGYPLTVDGIELFQIGTALDAEIDSVFAYGDADTNGLFDPGVDAVLAAEAVDGASLALGPLGLRVLPGRISYIFVSYDLAMVVVDSSTIDLTLFDSQDLVVIPESSEIQGEFPINSPGVDRTNGMIAAQLNLEAAPASSVAPTDSDVLAMTVTIPANGVWPDALEFVTVQNSGSAVSGTDVADVRVWREVGGDPLGFDAGADQPLAFLLWNGGAWMNNAPLDEAIPIGGLRTYVTFSVAGAPADNATFRARIPVNGVQVASGNDGPIDAAVSNPASQRISTAPFITSVGLDRSSYSVGQSMTVEMRLRNRGTDTLFTVRPHPLRVSGTGQISAVAGPVPAQINLPPNADTTMTWQYSADGAGDVQFCGSAYDGDSLVVSEETCSMVLSIQNRASSVPVRLTSAAPATANRGQSAVPLACLQADYTSHTAPAAPIRLQSLVVGIDDGTGVLLPPNSVFNRMILFRANGANQAISLADSVSNPLVLRPATPIMITPGDSLKLDLLCDLSQQAAGSYRVSVGGLGDIAIVDENDGSAVSLVPANAFPWRSTTAIVNAPAESVLVSAGAAADIRANHGQEDVPLFSLSLLNPGDPGTARGIVTDLTLAFFDTSNTAIVPDGVIRSVRFLSGTLTLVDTQDIARAGSALHVNLTTPLILPPGASEPLNVLVDLRTLPSTPAFRVEIEGASSFVARDFNTGGIIPVAALDPSAMDFPFVSNRIVFQEPASGLSATFEDRLPRSILPEMTGVPVMDLVLEHLDATASSSLRVVSVGVRFADSGGSPVYPGDCFSALTVVHEGDTLSRVTSLSSTQSVVECALQNGVSIEPATAETLSVFVDSKNVFTPTECEIFVDEQTLVVLDANDGRRLFGVQGAFPMMAGPVSLQLPSTLVLCGIGSRAPRNVGASTPNLAVLDLFVRNGDEGGFTAVEMEAIRFAVESSRGAAINPTQLFSGARLLRGGVEVAAGQIDDAIVQFDFSSSQLIVPSSEIDTLSLRVDVNTRLENVTFRLVLDDTSSTSFVDVVTGNAVPAGTIGNAGYPLRSALTHVLGSDMDRSFTNFPNPFAAGREPTRITYMLDQPSTVTMKLYTIWGDPVRTLVSTYVSQSGLHEDVEWDGRNGDGHVVSNGVYYLVLEILGRDGGKKVLKRKVAVLR